MQEEYVDNDADDDDEDELDDDDDDENVLICCGDANVLNIELLHRLFVLLRI